MRISISKKFRALSLTELLIVLAIIAMLFAAMAPIVTKRKAVQSYENESVWNFVPNDAERNSYYDPGITSWSSSAYIGMIPTLNEVNPGKLVINSGDITHNGTTYPQHHIQFRYGLGRGVNAGSLILRNNSIIFGSDTTATGTSLNTAAGLNVMRMPINSTSKLVAYGDSAFAEANVAGNGINVVAVGDHAGFPFASNVSTMSGNVYNTFIGANSGTTGRAVSNNVAIGYNVIGNLDYNSNNNVFVGSQVGGGFLNNAGYNTIIGSAYSGNGTNNTIIGYKAFESGDSNMSNMTAIGYGACDSVTSSISGSKVCIGYNSAHFDTKSSPNTLGAGEHIFIGGSPQGGFGGRSVLEVHRTSSPSGNSMLGNVIFNSNLVVRGEIYLEGGNTRLNKNPRRWHVAAANVPDKIVQCVGDTYFNDIYSKNDIYSAFMCNKDSIFSTYEIPSRVTPFVTGTNLEEVSDSTANLGGYPTYIVSPSDIRLKKNISENNDGLNKILQIMPFNYNFKDDPDKKPQVGVIAQDLQKIFPNSVMKDSKGFLSIRWDEMFYALINSVKSLNTKLTECIDSIKIMKKDTKIISSEHKKIKNRISSINKRINKLEKK